MNVLFTKQDKGVNIPNKFNKHYCRCMHVLEENKWILSPLEFPPSYLMHLVRYLMFLPALTRRGRDHQERSSLRLVLNVHPPSLLNCLVNILFTLLQHIPLVNAEVAKGVAVIDLPCVASKKPSLSQ